MIRSNLWVAFFILILSMGSSHAKIIKIFHTNDLHSQFLANYSERGSDRAGGYARVKWLLDDLKKKANEEGVPYLALDAGDFSEGSVYFLANNGLDSFKALDLFGFDATTLGNHDWLTGSGDLERILGEVNLRTPILASNFEIGPEFSSIHKHIKPYELFERNGIRIAVVGATTNERLYRWAAKPGKIHDPEENLKEWTEQLKEDSDVTILLTHLGIDAESRLGQKVPWIDVVVGGHTHTVLEKPVMVVNEADDRFYARDVEVPVVQAGSHGHYVGELTLEVLESHHVVVKEYKLHKVEVSIPKDTEMDVFVTLSKETLKQEIPDLDSVVAHADHPLLPPIHNHKTPWGDFAVEVMHEATDAQFSFDVGSMQGVGQSSGPLTMEKIFNLYPRVFDFNRLGWNIFTFFQTRAFLETFLSVSYGSQMSPTFSGGEVQCKEPLKRLIANPFKVLKQIFRPRCRVYKDQKRLKRGHFYKIAVNEGIAKGFKEMFPLMNHFTLFRLRDTGVPIVEALKSVLEKNPKRFEDNADN